MEENTQILEEKGKYWQSIKKNPNNLYKTLFPFLLHFSSCFFKLTTSKQFFVLIPQRSIGIFVYQNIADRKTTTFHLRKWRKRVIVLLWAHPALPRNRRSELTLWEFCWQLHIFKVFASIVFWLLGFLAPFPSPPPLPVLLMKWHWKEGRRDGFTALLLFSILFFPCPVLLEWQQPGILFFFLKWSHFVPFQWYPYSFFY